MDVVIPGYRIIKKAAKGGMASIFVAIQQNFDRLVALKIMAPHLTDDSIFGQRFQREARIVSRLNHRNIVPVFDVGQHGPYHYLAMEYLPGGDLKSRLRIGLETTEALRVVYEIANALDYAHSKSYIHRDIKPENILFREDSTVVLTDFGIAKAMDGSDLNMTCTGVIVGSPHYMSPEQALAKRIDSRTDIYSLGVVLFEALTGHPMYEADSSVAAAIKHVSDRIPRLPKNLKHLQRILEKMVAKTPDNRFQTAAEVAEALESFLQTPPCRNSTPLLHTGSFAPKWRSARQVLRIPQRTQNAGATRTPLPATSNAEATLIDHRFQSACPLDEPAQLQPEQAAPEVPAPPPPAPKRRLAPLAGVVLSPLVGLGLWLAVDGDDNTLSVGPGASFAASQHSATTRAPATSTPALAADDPPIPLMAYSPVGLAPQYILMAPLPSAAPYTATRAEQQIPLMGQAAPVEEKPEPTTAQPALVSNLGETMEEPAEPQQQPPEPAAAPVDPAQAKIDQLLRRGKAAILRHHLTVPEGGSAYDHFTQALQLQPGHPAALQGLEDVVNAYLTLAGRKLNLGDLDTALTYAQRAQKVTKRYPLPESSRVATTQLQRTVTELQQKEERLSYLETMWEIEKWSTTLQQPDELTVENLDHAYNVYMAAIEARIQASRLDTANNIYADAFYALGRRYLKDNKLDMSRQLINKGLQINPQHQNLQKLLARWERRRDGKESLFDRLW